MYESTSKILFRFRLFVGLNNLNLNDLNNDLLKYQEMKKYLSDIIKLEGAMSNLTSSVDINKLKPFKVSQLASEVPFLNWTAFFQSAFTSVHGEQPIIFDDLEVLIQVTTHYALCQYQKNTHICIQLVGYHLGSKALREIMMKAFFH